MVSLDGMVVWAFGDGDHGKLGTGSSTAKYYPQVGQRYQRFTFRNPGRTKSLCLCFFFFPVCRKLSNFAIRELRRSVVELSSLWPWPVMDMSTHLVKVHFTVKFKHVM